MEQTRREAKKAHMRQRLSETAQQLIAERGFSRVTVAQIAATAGVAVATVFNYFGTKEALFFSGLEAFGAGLVEAIRERTAQSSHLDAAAAFILEGQSGWLEQIAAGDHGAFDRAHAISKVIEDSASLRAYELVVGDDIAQQLADVLMSDAGVELSPIEAETAARAIVGVHRTLVLLVRRRLLEHDHPERIAADVRAAGRDAFAALEGGLTG